jgi:hypothetical protein
LTSYETNFHQSSTSISAYSLTPLWENFVLERTCVSQPLQCVVDCPPAIHRCTLRQWPNLRSFCQLLIIFNTTLRGCENRIEISLFAPRHKRYQPMRILRTRKGLETNSILEFNSHKFIGSNFSKVKVDAYLAPHRTLKYENYCLRAVKINSTRIWILKYAVKIPSWCIRTRTSACIKQALIYSNSSGWKNATRYIPRAVSLQSILFCYAEESSTGRRKVDNLLDGKSMISIKGSNWGSIKWRIIERNWGSGWNCPCRRDKYKNTGADSRSEIIRVSAVRAF